MAAAGGARSSVDVKSWAVTSPAGLQVRPLMVMAALASATQKSWSGSSSAAATNWAGGVMTHRATTTPRRASNIGEEEEGRREEAMGNY